MSYHIPELQNKIEQAPPLSKHYLMRGETLDRLNRSTYTNKEADQKRK